MRVKKFLLVFFVFLCVQIDLIAKGGGGSSPGPTLKTYQQAFKSKGEKIEYANYVKKGEIEPNKEVDLIFDKVFSDAGPEEAGQFHLSSQGGNIWIVHDSDNKETIYFKDLTISSSNPCGKITINSEEVKFSTSYTVKDNDVIQVHFDDRNKTFSYSFKKDITPPKVNQVNSFIRQNGSLKFNVYDEHALEDSVMTRVSNSEEDLNKDAESKRKFFNDEKYFLKVNNEQKSINTKYTNIQKPIGGGTTNGIPIFVFQCTNYFECEYRVDDDTDGNRNVTFSVSDKVGNTTTINSFYIVDNTLPEIKFNSSPKKDCQTAVINFSVSDANNIETITYSYKLNGESKDPTEVSINDKGEYTINFTEEGNYSNFKIFATDLAGNSNEKALTDFKVDNTPPILSLSDSSKGEWTKDVIKIVVTANTGNGSPLDTTSWKYILDGSQYKFNGDTFDKEFTDLSTGEHKLEVIVADQAENQNSIVRTLKFDNSAPTKPAFSITDKEGKKLKINNDEVSEYVAKLKISASSTDKESGITSYSFSTDGSNWTSPDGSEFEISKTYEGYIYCKVTDNVGNVSEIAKVKVHVDTEIPKVTWPPFDSLTWFKTKTIIPEVSNQCNSGIDSNTWEYSINGGSSYLPLTNSVNGKKALILSATGKHSVCFRVKSNTGITGSSNLIEVRIDATVPQISIDEEIPSKANSYKITATTSDTHSGISENGYILNNDESTRYKGTQKNTITAELGEESIKTIRFYAIDNAGNEGWSKEYQIVIDKTAPVIEWKSFPTGWVKAAVLEADSKSADVNNDTWILYYKNKDDEEKKKNGKSVSLTEHGKYKVWFTVADDCGNISKSTEKDVYIDTLPPEFTGYTQNKNKIIASASDSDSKINDNSWMWSLDKKNYLNGSTATLSDGENKTVYFKVEDNCGNIAMTEYTIARVDVTPPEISFVSEEYNYNNKLSLNNISVTDKLSGVQKTAFYVDDVQLAESTENKALIDLDISRFGEGKHTVWLKAWDIDGNWSETEKSEFIIDRTRPEIKEHKWSYQGSEIKDDDFIGSEEFTVEVQASDDSKKIRAIHYGISAKEGDVPEDRKSQGKDKIVLNTVNDTIDEGRCFIYVWAEDVAGNYSLPVIRTVVKDIAKPGKAVISSSTHKKALAVTDAELNADASFTVMPSRTSGAGIKGYRYSLEEGWSAEAGRIVKSGSINSSGPQGLSFTSLKDNEEGEYYFLKVWCKGGNDVESDESVYCFRVDTTPPAGLYISISPQVNYESTYFYNAENTSISWNVPKDLTGIENYKIEIKAEGVNVYSDLIKSNSLFLNIKKLLKDNKIKAGCVEVEVTAYDYATNSVNAHRNFNADFEEPEFGILKSENLNPETKLIIDNIPGNDTAKKISWGKLSDKQGPCEQLVLEYTKLDGDESTNRIVINAEDGKDLPTEYTIDTLRNESAYYLRILGYDKAGNSVVLEDSFATGKAKVPDVIRSEYRENIDGLTITGVKETKNKSSTLIQGKILLTDNIQVFENRTENGVTSQIRINDLKIKEHTPLAADNKIAEAEIEASEGTKSFETKTGGYSFINEGFMYEAESGLLLTGVTLSVPVKDNFKESDTVYFEKMEAGYPNSLYLQGVSDEKENPLTVKTGGFDIENVNKVKTEGDKNSLYNSKDSVYFEAKKIDIATKEGSRKIPLEYAYTDSVFGNVYGDISAKDMILKLGETEFIVKKAGISGNLLNIYEAQVVLPEGYTPSQLTIKDFSINDESLEVSQGKYFKCEEINAEDGGNVIIKKGSVTLGKDGTLLVSGYLHTGTEYGFIEVSELELTNSGLDIESGCNVKTFSLSLYGYNITVKKARYSKDRLLITEGEIEVYKNLFKINGLGIDTDKKDSVYKACDAYGSGNCDTGYTAQVFIRNVRIDENGVYAKEMEVPVYGSEGNWKFSDVLLKSSGEVSVNSTDNFHTVVAGYSITAEQTSFDGQEIKIEKAVITNASGFKNNKLEISGIKLNSNTLVSGGESAEGVVYNLDGWNVVFGKISLSEKGLSGKAGIKNEGENFEAEVSFDEFTIESNGNFKTSKTAGDESYVMTNDYYFEVSDAELKLNAEKNKWEIHSSAPELITGENETVKLKNLYIDSEGKARLDTYNKNYTLITSNGCEIDVKETRFDGKSIFLKGSGKPGAFTKGKNSSLIELELLPSIKVRSEYYADVEYTYNYKGWNIKGCGIQFKKDYIEIVSNKVDYNGSEIELGDLLYSMDGRLLGENIQPQDVLVPIISNVSKVTETRFSEEGLFATVNIALPEMFNNSILAYNSVCLLPDGSFESETVISHAEIPLGKVNFNFDYVSLSKKGLSIGYASIRVPDLDNLSIELKGLSISNKGKVELKGCVTSPFQLWNMTFSISKLSIDDNQIDFKGSIRLPESLPGILSGRTVGIRKFTIGLDGNIKEFDARLEGKYTIPFLDSFALSVTSVGVAWKNNAPWVMMEKASLIMPSNYCIDNISITDVAFNPVKGEFDFDTIRAETNLSTTLSGITFNLTSVSITKALTIGFSGNAYFGGEELPDFIRGRSVELKQFEIKSDGKLGNIEVELSGLGGKLSPDIDVVELRDGSLAVKKEDGSNSLYLSVSGALEFTDRAPEFLLDANGKGGVALRLEKFTIDASKPCITELKAGLSRKVDGRWSNNAEEINFDPKLGETQLNDVYAAFSYNGETKEGSVTLSGGLILPDSLPDGIKGTEVRINKFEIGLDGQVKEFGAEYNIEKTAIGDVELKKVHLGVDYINSELEYSVGATMVLPKDKFMEGIGGLTTTASLKFTANELKYVNANFNIGDTKILNSLEIKGASIGVLKNGKDALLFSLAGRIVLPETLPDGLKGTEITISSFTISQYGEILDIDIGARNIGATLFGQLQLSGGRVTVSKGSAKNELLIDVGGMLSFAKTSSVPDGLKDASFAINKLQVSTASGLVAFDAGLGEGIQFQVLGGVDVYVNNLSFSDKGFKVSAGAGLSFPSVDFGGVRFDATIDMLWNGKITAFNGGLGELNVKIAGFKGSIKQLYVGKFDNTSDFMVTLKECRLTLPDNFGAMGGSSVALKNATFNPNTGDFNGDFELPALTTEIAGFTLILDAPTINFKEYKIEFAKASLDLPAFFNAAGANVSLYDIVVSSRTGLSIGGGGFMLPDFKLGEFGFRNVGAEFRMQDGHYFISGHGGIILPNVGEIEAALCFTEVTEVYPIGLKHAYFSFEAATGIPLGATGLNLSGIRGGLGYGFPDEVPEEYRNLFGEKGPRVQLGLTVKDASGGNLVRMTADTWIDIEDPTWVLEGKATILKGTLNISANAAAIIRKDCFATGMNIHLIFIHGSIKLFIFDQNGTLKFSGEGEAKFFIPEAYIYDGWIINIPPFDISLGGLGVMFGDFTNGKRGFLGYIDLEFLWIHWGRIGAFVGTGGLDLRVSSYDICRPEGINFSAISGPVRSPNLNILDNNYSMAGINPGGTIYKVVIPGGKRSQMTETLYTKPLTGLSKSVGDTGSQLPEIIEPDTEAPVKTSFIIGYLEGDPEFTLYSPSGKKYKAGEEGIDTQYIENGLLINIDNPEGGEWTISVDNMAEGTYELAAFGVDRIPDVSVEEPSDGLLNVTDSVYVSGRTSEKDKEVYIFAGEDEYSPGVELGCLKSDSEGRFAGYVSTDNVADGEYMIFARVLTKDGMYSPAGVAGGKYNVNRSGLKLKSPENVYAAESEDNRVKLLWQNTNGRRTAGYKLKSIKNGKETIDDLGNITELYISNYQSGTEVLYSLCAYDEYGNESDYTQGIGLTIGEEKSEHNRVYVKDKTVEVKVKNGETAECTVDVSYKNWKDEVSYIQASKVDTGRKDYNEMSDEDFIELLEKGEENSYSSETENIDVSFDKNIQVSKDGNLLKVYVSPSDICAEGEYTVECEVSNDNNPSNKDNFTLKITVENPSPAITGIYPAIVDGTHENEVTVYGSGFVAGTRFFLDETELLTVPGEAENLSNKTVQIPVIKKRGEHILKVVNGKGESAEYVLSVIVPSYDINLYTTEITLNKGDRGCFNLSVSPFDGYAEDAQFSVEECSSELAVTLPVISMNGEGCIEVNTDQASEGDYSIRIKASSGVVFELKVHITEDKILPVITSFNPYKLNRGMEVSVIGYGFGSSGKLYVNDAEIKVISYTDSKIDFVVPKDTEGNTVSIFVENANGKSEVIIKNVYDYNFTVHIPNDVCRIKAGQSEKVNIALNGYADDIKLNTYTEADAPFEVKLSKTLVSTNALVEMQIDCNEKASAGEYNVVFTAEGNSINVTKTVKVIVSEDIKIVTETLPQAVLGVRYESSLEAESEGEEIVWKISRGALPEGIKLNGASGKLEGVPAAGGEYIFTVRCETKYGIYCEKELALTVQDEIWQTAGKNGGNTNSVASDIPSVGHELWNAEQKDAIAQIYSNGSKVVTLTKSGRMSIYSERGKLLYDSKDILYKRSFITNRCFYGITNDGILEARTLEKGFIMWKREDVREMSFNASVLLVQTSSGTLRIDPVSGSLLEEVNANLTGCSLVWNNEKLYGYSGNKLYGLYGTESQAEVNGRILKVSADAQGFVVLCENGLCELTPNLEPVKESIIRNDEDAGLAVLNNEILVSDTNASALYDRETLKVVRVYAGGENAALANEKLVTAGPSKLSVNNIYSGKEIWSVNGNFTALAMCNGKLYAADKNILRVYGGSSNASAPEVKVTYEPEADGVDGWYKCLPSASIIAEDKETYVESVWYRFNGGEFMQYTESFDTVEGENVIEAYAYDSKGMKSDTVTSVIRTDITKPVSQIHISAEENAYGWYEKDLSVRFTANDGGSGLNRIVVNGKVYDKPLEFTDEGIYDLKWYAVDNAGNAEEEKSIVIRLDKFKPTTRIEILSDKGMSIIRLNASDSASGVDRITYRIDKGSETVYDGEIKLYDAGRHTIYYKAYDKSGKASNEEYKIFTITKEDGKASLMAFAKLNEAKRNVITPFSYDSMIYENDAPDYTKWPYHYWERAYLHTLPYYVTGGDYVQYKGSDMNIKGKRTVEFYLKKDVTLYMFAGPEMKVGAGWKLVEKKFGMQSDWYRDGWNVYKRTAVRGEKIVVEVGSDVLALPVITAKQER